MKAPLFTYHDPRTIVEVTDLLGSLENARMLGGGQSLMPMLNLRLAAPDHLIDLGRIPDLVGIEDRDDTIAIRSMTTQRAVERSDLIRREMPLLAQAVALVGHQQTRNRGTIGGSLCHLDPGAELPVAAAALEAVFIAAGPAGLRRLGFEDFAVGYLSNGLAADELLVAIEIGKLPPRSGSAFLEFNRRPADFAIVSVAVQVSLASDDLIERVAIAVGGIGYAPVRLREVEQALTRQRFDLDALRQALTVLSSLEIDGDALYPADFRRQICGVLTERAVVQAIGIAGTRS